MFNVEVDGDLKDVQFSKQGKILYLLYYNKRQEKYVVLLLNSNNWEILNTFEIISRFFPYFCQNKNQLVFYHHEKILWYNMDARKMVSEVCLEEPAEFFRSIILKDTVYVSIDKPSGISTLNILQPHNKLEVLPIKLEKGYKIRSLFDLGNYLGISILKSDPLTEKLLLYDFDSRKIVKTLMIAKDREKVWKIYTSKDKSTLVFYLGFCDVLILKNLKSLCERFKDSLRID